LELGRPAKKPSLSSSGIKPPVPKTRWNSDAKSSLKQTSQASPIDLSLADDEYGRKDSTGHGGRSGERSPEMRKKNGGIHVGSPVEDAELLYEYFPLLLDDWWVLVPASVLAIAKYKIQGMRIKLIYSRMPPVDAIYRPHVVHHIHPPEMMAQQVKGKQKRYFSADDWVKEIIEYSWNSNSTATTRATKKRGCSKSSQLVQPSCKLILMWQ
jgi:hypothetical protein